MTRPRRNGPTTGARREGGIGAWRALLALGPLASILLVLVLFAVDLPVLHPHDEPGVYDEECPLARVAVGHRAGSSVRGPEVSHRLLSLAASPSPEPPAPSSRPPLPLGARAPPVPA